MGGRHRAGGAAGGHVLMRRRTAAADHVFARSRTDAAARQATRAQQILAPLCILAAGTAFGAEVVVGTDAPTFGALAVVPVLAATLLRSRSLTLIVVAFSVLLQVWGVGVGAVSRDTAGMQIAVYLLTLAVIVLQRAQPLEAIGREHEMTVLDAVEPASEGAPRELPAPRPVIHVAGREAHHPPLDGETAASHLPLLVADALTPRERDVVLLAARGLTAREIGGRLFIGDRTVETHLANAYGKLGVRSKVELVRLVAASADHHSDLRTGTEAPKRATA